MERTMKRYGVNHRFSTSYHPQTSGQVKNTNIALKRIIEKTVKDNLAVWSRKLDDALWAFRTAYKTPTGSLEDIPSSNITKIEYLYTSRRKCTRKDKVQAQKCKLVARDEKWVPSTERVKISFANVRLETTVQQKEETFQVIIDVIKNSTCFKAFTISVDVPKIFMQQFWYTIKKVKDLESYEFLLANKKCLVDAEVFRKILDICPRMEGKEFTKDDGIVSRLKFVRIREDYQEYGLPIPNMMLNDKIKPSESYQMFIKYSTVDVSEEFKPEPAMKKTGSRSTRGVVIQDSPSAPILKLATLKLKLKGVQSLTPEEQEDADIMHALKESKKTSKRHPGTEGSSERTDVSPGVPNESKVVPATSSEGTGTIPGVLDEENVTSEENVILVWGSEQESEYSEEDQGDDEEVDWIDSNEDEETKDDANDDKSIDLEMTNDEETDDEFVQGDEQVNDDEDEEMTNAEVEESGNGDVEISDAAKVDVENTKEVKDDAKKTELPPTSSSLSVSSAPIPTPPIIIDAPTITTAVPESDALSAVQLRVAKLEKDVSELKKIDHSVEALDTLKSQVPTVVEHYLGSKITPVSSKIQKPTIDLEQEYKKSASEICKIKREQAEKQKMPKYTIKSTNKATLKEYHLKSALYQTMNENKSFNRIPANHALYHELMKALIEDENAMDKGVADTVKNHKRQHDD
ncbi:retrovirus-related pol polyprotein from transposon TNT 1-94 [Tanacetum coccineum]|uniref:Retrovirus-related pol polyprotein from transposon TNT 1-94 n=1 Tax=Tanacetum coccineum TaxID=301880 RepID=A0ABQ5E3L9_9ASTR